MKKKNTFFQWQCHEIFLALFFMHRTHLCLNKKAKMILLKKGFVFAEIFAKEVTPH